MVNEVIANNPHWVGNLPAWDITLTDGQVHKDVTQVEIRQAIRELSNTRSILPATRYIDVVRKVHIDLYNEYHAKF